MTQLTIVTQKSYIYPAMLLIKEFNNIKDRNYFQKIKQKQFALSKFKTNKAVHAPFTNSNLRNCFDISPNLNK